MLSNEKREGADILDPGGVSSRAVLSPPRESFSQLGWDILSEREGLFSNAWPVLSLPEKELVHVVLHAFYEQPPVRQTREDLQRLFYEHCRIRRWQLDEEQQTYLEKTLREHAFDAGPLTELLAHSSLEEIAITGASVAHPVRVYHAHRGWMSTPLYFTDEKVVIHWLNRLALKSGKRLSGQTPTLNAQLNGNQRVHASMAPVCVSGVEASIRKYVIHATHPQQLVQTNVISSEALAYAVTALQTDCNMLIVGNTGSGKTTTLNALLGCLPTHERLILVEETPELHLSNEHVVRLTPVDAQHVSMATLIRETLRMRPDRVVVGEIRFPEEAKAFMESVLAGQGKGTYATFHGHSSFEALARLKQFGLLESDLGWVNLILVQRRWSERISPTEMIDRRVICEIVEMVKNKNGEWNILPLFEWSPSAHAWMKKNESTLIRERFAWSFPHQSFNTHIQRLTKEFSGEKKWKK